MSYFIIAIYLLAAICGMFAVGTWYKEDDDRVRRNTGVIVFGLFGLILFSAATYGFLRDRGKPLRLGELDESKLYNVDAVGQWELPYNFVALYEWPGEDIEHRDIRFYYVEDARRLKPGGCARMEGDQLIGGECPKISVEHFRGLRCSNPRISYVDGEYDIICK